VFVVERNTAKMKYSSASFDWYRMAKCLSVRKIHPLSCHSIKCISQFSRHLASEPNSTFHQDMLIGPQRV
jgi:hypothetical protein